MLAIGIGAFFLRRRGYEMAPLVLGLVLGELLDKSLRRGLVSGRTMLAARLALSRMAVSSSVSVADGRDASISSA